VTLEHSLTRDPGPKTPSGPCGRTSSQGMDHHSATGLNS
jgi:hypothetical protein